MTARERLLKAIMFSDVKSFSAMMATNEERTVRLIKEHREIIRGVLPAYGGEEHGTAGDSFFVLFGSAVNAVQCAVEIQEKFHELNAPRPEEEQIWIRIGIHIGDIIVDKTDNRVYGDGINIAARTEPRAEPGGICITQDVFQQVENKLGLRAIRIGKQEMKNIVHAPELYRVILGGVATMKEDRRSPPGRSRAPRFVIAGILLAGVALTAAFALGRGRWQGQTAATASSVPLSVVSAASVPIT